MSVKLTTVRRLTIGILSSIMFLPVMAERVSHTFSAGEFAITTTYDHEGRPTGHYSGPVRMCGMTWMIDYAFDGEMPVVKTSDDGGVYIGRSDDGYGFVDGITLRCLDHYNCYIRNIYIDGTPAHSGSNVTVTAPDGRTVLPLDGSVTLPDNYLYNRELPFEIKIDCGTGGGVVLKSLDMEYDSYRPVPVCPEFVPVARGETYEFPEGSTVVVGEDVPVENYSLDGNRLTVYGFTPAKVTPPKSGSQTSALFAQNVNFYPFAADENWRSARLLYADGPLTDWPKEDPVYARSALSGGQEVFDVKVSRDEYSPTGTVIIGATSFSKSFVRLSANGTLGISAPDACHRILCVEVGELPQSGGLVDADKIVTDPEADYSFANNRHVFVPRTPTSFLTVSHSDGRHDLNMSDVAVHYTSGTTDITLPEASCPPMNSKVLFYDLTGRAVSDPARGVYVRVAPEGVTKVVVR